MDTDCGAGVGRVTKNFLLQHFHEVQFLGPQLLPSNVLFSECYHSGIQ